MNESVIFNAAVKLPKEQRAAFLEAACNGNPRLRAEVEGLLREHDGAGGFMDRPAAQPPATTDSSSMHRPGAIIAGRFKLLEQIGEGGMGAVWVAEQTEPVRRRVALKLIKPGMDTKQVLSRFAAERQALALMDHPNIAKVYDGGMTEEGRPFFVMEYVKGVPITEYCDQTKLSIEERLKLFLPICQAVQHAHQKGIIHRDLKPSNLLVCLYDGQPVPKVIDFGLAKAISQPLTEHTLYTAHGLMVGTPMYMSPEQAEFNNLDVDTRTDIYSLGVILYELLTGTTPLEKKKFKDAAFQEILRLIKEEEPPKPSTKLSGSASLPAIAAQRGLEPAQLSRVVRGELDWIVMKALEKERSRRYETANGLTRDLERYLHDEPVEACPPSLGYKFSKFARRNSRALVTAALFSVVVVGALVTVAGSIGWAVRDRETRQDVVESKILQALDKAEAAYKQDKLAEAQAAVHQAEGLLASVDPRPEVAERYRQWQADLAMVDQLEKIHLEKAAAVKDEHFDPASAVIPYGKAFQEYGLDLQKIGPLEAAQKLQTAPIKKHLLAALDDWAFISDVAQRMKLLNIARQADSDPWRNRLRIGLESRDVSALKELAADAACVSQSSISLAVLASQLAKLAERTAAIALLRRAQGPYPNDFWINEHLGNLLLLDNKADEAAIYLRMASGKFPNSPVSRNNLGVALAFSNKLPEAAEEYRAAIRAKPDFAMPHYNLAELLMQQGKFPEAESSFRDAVRLRPTSGAMHAGLADCLVAQDKIAEGEKSFLEALARAPDDWGINEGYLAMLSRANRLAAAQQDYRQQLKAKPGDARSHRLLGDVLRRNNDLAAAETEYREAIRLNRADGQAHTKLGAALLEQEKLAEAESVLREAVRLEPELSAAQLHLGAALNRQNKWTEAESVLRKALELDPNEYLAYMVLSTNLRNQNKGTADLPRPTTLGPSVGLGANPKARRRFKAEFELGMTYRTYTGFTEREMLVFMGRSFFSSGTPGSTSARGSSAEEAQLRVAIQRNPKDWAARERLGALLISQNSSAASTAMWEAVCADPTNYKFHAYLGVANRVRRDYSEAALRESIRLKPNYAYAHKHLAWALEGQGKYPEALAASREAIQLDPTDGQYHNVLAWFLAKHGELAAAEAAYREELKLRPERAQTHNDLALVLHRLGKTNEAAAEFELAKVKSPQQFSNHAELGNHYASNSEFWQAAHHYQAAIAQNPDDCGAASRAALLLLLQGDRSGYESVCRRILNHFGQTKVDVDVHRVVQTCLITPQIVGDLPALTRLAEQLVGRGDLSVIAPRDRGLVSYRNGNWEETLRWCRESRAECARILAGQPSASTNASRNEQLYNAQNLILEAMALHQQGKAAAARKTYENAARLGSGFYPFAPYSVYDRWKEWLTYEISRREAAQLLGVQDNSDWPLSPGRGRALAGAGDWKSGAAELARGCESPAANSLDFIAAGTALARAEDREGFRKHCQAMIERFGGTGEWNEIERTVKVCALAPFDVEIPAEMLAAVSKDIDENKLEAWLAAWGNAARAHAAYRQGRHEDAARWADSAAQETNAVLNVRAQGYLISAMAHQRLGDSAAAKARLSSALEARDRQPWPKLPDGSLNERLLVTEYTGWWDVLAIDLMRREVVALLEAKASRTGSAELSEAKTN